MTAFGWIIFMVSEEATSYITDGNICTHPRLAPFQFIFRLQMQENFGAHYDLVEMKLPEICDGTPEYQENIKFLQTTIAQLKTPEGSKAMQVTIFFQMTVNTE